MSTYTRARDISGTPVVTLHGEDVGQVKDVVFDPARGSVSAFTLSGRGLLAGPLHRTLPWDDVHGLGPDAVMVRDEEALEEDRKRRKASGGGSGFGVLGATMITRDGTLMGTVTDVIIETGRHPVVAGYEVETRERRRVLVPVDGPVAVSGDRIVVPDAAARHRAGDLDGFESAAEALRRPGGDDAGQER
ncbi:PRC-barrel domain protein [Streptomyces sp. CC53]|uniref:PRC-barrel domain-containing protein n=1 Tax=unclassified Streptomyces TaxID=2593676 RepID=UPI0008DCC311|nr:MULTISPECIES: PRC-barrel domain-containing protein [unclassified Streptomyces]OII64999.1 PRC-barrel domain protein [Streptomyces sp. CC53]OII67406.1 PRC-barrel domain protein [Streptomyces sp. CC77]